MPRDSSGNYTLPAVGNPVVTGTVISSVWANTTLSDIGTEITDSLDRSGKGGMLAPLQLASGAIGAPGLTWTAETTSGLYRAGAGDFRYSITGSDLFRLGNSIFGITATVESFGNININNSNPSLYLWDSDGAVDTKLWRINVPAGLFTFSTRTDANGLGNTWLSVARTGTTVDSIQTTGTQFSHVVAGNTYFSVTNAAVNIGSGLVTYTLALQGVAGTSRDFAMRSGGTNRWILRTTGTAEGGGNSGSDFQIISRDDAGAALVTAINISRATGIVTFAGAQTAFASGVVGSPSITFNSDTTSGMWLNAAGDVRWSISGAQAMRLIANQLIVGLGSSTTVTIDGPAGTNRQLSFSTALSPRWIHQVNTTAEGGGNAGSNYVLLARDDAGAALFTIWTMTRSTGITAWSQQTQFQSPGGAGAPGISFAGDPDTGIYNSGGNLIDFSTGGTFRFEISTAAITSTLVYVGPVGAVGAPTYTFTGDTTSGLYRVGASDVGITTGGTLRFDVSTTAITSTLPHLNADGAAAGPAYAFSGATDMGMYRSGTVLGFANGGVVRFTISTTLTQTNLSFNPTAGIVNSDGAVGTPSYTFNSDNDTGFWKDVANQIAIALGGASFGEIATGTYTATYTGGTTSPTVTVRWAQIGPLMILFIPAISATSNAATWTLTGGPAAIQPVRTQSIPISEVVDNGTTANSGSVQMSAGSGTITFKRVGGTNNWTASGTKSLPVDTTIMYYML